MEKYRTFTEGAMARKAIIGMILVVLFSALGIAGFYQTPPDTPTSPHYREGYLLVRFAETGVGATADALRAQILQSAGGGTIQKMYTSIPGLALVKLPAGKDVASAKITYSATAGIQYAEPDYKLYLSATPNDPFYNNLWGMNNTGQTGGTEDADIDAPEAWGLATGSSTIIVAVTDTGINYNHEDLASNMWINTAEQNGTAGVDDDNNGYIDDIYGYDFYLDNSDPMDDHDHGSHVAGTIGGIGNNGKGVAGINWHVRMMALKIFQYGGGSDPEGLVSAAAAAIEYATNKGAKVINASWHLPFAEYSQTLYDAISYAGDHGVMMVIAAGNDNVDNDVVPDYPQSFDLPNIISVMATDDNDQKASFSNYGKINVDLAAPGVDIFSCYRSGGYGYMSGTSMACPHVAGACALVWSTDPSLTVAELKQILLYTVDPLDSLTGLCVTGGRLNLHKAILASKVGDTVPPTPDPAKWSIVPQATGLHQIVMEAAKASDPSGVQYKFDCIENDDLDSGWQDSPLYIVANADEGKSYTFRCKARDKSNSLNETQWSEEKANEEPTSVGIDTLPPAPDPSQWKAAPRAINSYQIGMELKTSYDENGVVYKFDCLSAGYKAGQAVETIKCGEVTSLNAVDVWQKKCV